MAPCLSVWKGRSAVCYLNTARPIRRSSLLSKQRRRFLANGTARDVQRSDVTSLHSTRPRGFDHAPETIEDCRLQVQSILSSPAWARLFDKEQNLLPITETVIQAALSESVQENELEWPMNMRVDALVRRLVLDGHFDRAAEFLEKCTEADMANDSSLGSFFKVCQEANRFDIAANVARRWIEAKMVNFRGHSANKLVYSGFLAEDVDQTLSLLRFMHQQKIPFESDYPYSMAIHACNAHERPDDALDVYCLFNTTKRRKSSILIRNLLDTSQVGEYVFLFRELVDGILQSRANISWDLFKAMMETCKHFKDLDRGKAVFGAFLQNRTRVNTRCINTLISIYKDATQFPPLEECFGLFERLGVRPDCFTIGLLLKCAYKTRQPLEVVDRIMEEAQSWNVEMNPIIILTACTAYRHANGSPLEQRIQKTLDLIVSTDNVDQGCYHLVMGLCMEAHRLEDARDIQKRMEAAGYPSNSTTTRILMSQKRSEYIYASYDYFLNEADA